MGNGGVDHNSVALHIKVFYFLIVVLILGEIGAYYYSLYLFRSVQEDCISCIVNGPTASRHRTEAGSQVPESAAPLRYDGDGKQKGEIYGGNRRQATALGYSDPDDPETDSPAGELSAVKLGTDNESDEPNAANQYEDDVSEDNYRHRDYRDNIDADIIDEDDVVKTELEEDDDDGDDNVMVIVEEEEARTSSKRRRRRKRRKAGRKRDTSEDRDKYVLMKASSQIPLQDLQNFCKATQSYCPAAPAGPPGPKGDSGNKGPKGELGYPGNTGAKGEQGDLGYPGDKGDYGPPGYSGLPGPKGQKGESGSPGKDGLDGLDGLEGIPGAPGLDGVPGIDGIDGIPGINGTPGNPGIPGRAGTNGTNGIHGREGPAGPIGPPGAPGLAGARGKRGSDGKPGTPGIPGIGTWMINGTKADKLLVPPVIVDKEIYKVIAVNEDTLFRLHCYATGQPRPDIVWRREDNAAIRIGSWQTNYVSGSTIEFPHINREHMGRYTCIASNGVPPMDTKTVNLEVTFRPYIVIPNSRVGTTNGSFALLECHIEAFPVSINDWLMEDGRPIENSTKYHISVTEQSYKVHMTLNITNIGPRDYVNYKCISRNELGETWGVVTVFKIGSYDKSGSSQPTKHGQGPPVHMSIDDICPTCPTCLSPHIYCPDRGGASNVMANSSVREIKPMRTLNCKLDQVGKPVYNRLTNSTRGTWMMDPHPPNDTSAQKYWVTSQNDSYTLYEYDNRTYYRNDSVSKTYHLDVPFRGNSHVIYNGSFYYHMNGTLKIVRRDLSSRNWTVLELPDLHDRDVQYLYTTNYNYMDFAVDENGMWVIYGLADSNNTLIMKFDPNSLQPQVTWNISLNHHTVGEMFVMCGILYAVDSVDNWTAHIRFAYDLYLMKGLDDVEIQFTNPFGMNTMVGYNPKERVLYSWDRGHQLTYPLKITSRGANLLTSDNEVETPNTT